MKCAYCPAQTNQKGKCLAGIASYQMKSGHTGCCFNMKQVLKHMKESQTTAGQ